MLDKRVTFGGDVIPAWIASAPKIVRPKRKGTITPIAGSNREVVELEEAWESYDQPYVMFVGDGTENNIQPILDEVARILATKSGYQVLTDDYDSEHYRLAYFKNSYEVENRFTRAGKFTLVFHCRPERYLISGNVELDVANNGTVFNPTGFSSKPLIHITGSGSGTLTVAGVTMAFTGITDYLNIDSDTMNCYRLPAENKNNLMTGDFPVLRSGDNTVAFTGGITSVTITPRFFII